MMNPEIKEKWLAALRSGEYKQTRHYLRDESGFCCLGVLCDLYSQENKVDWVESHRDYCFLEELQIIPEEVTEWAGLGTRYPEVSPEDSEPNEPCLILGVWIELAVLNDAGTDFESIADLIENSF